MNSAPRKTRVQPKTPGADSAPVSAHPAALHLKFPQTSLARRWLPGRRRLQKVLQGVWSAHGQAVAEVEVNLVDTRVICRLHQDYLGDPAPTDIITFDLGFLPDRSRLAALFICCEEAERQARRFRVAPSEEVRRLVVHGVLHLLGYGDHTPAARRQMRRRENRILSLAHE